VIPSAKADGIFCSQQMAGLAWTDAEDKKSALAIARAGEVLKPPSRRSASTAVAGGANLLLSADAVIQKQEILYCVFRLTFLTKQ